MWFLVSSRKHTFLKKTTYKKRGIVQSSKGIVGFSFPPKKINLSAAKCTPENCPYILPTYGNKIGSTSTVSQKSMTWTYFVLTEILHEIIWMALQGDIHTKVFLLLHSLYGLNLLLVWRKRKAVSDFKL